MGNSRPNWWLFVFGATILFLVGYWFYYQEFQSTPTPVAEDQATVGVGTFNVSEEELMALADDEGAVADGRAIYHANCLACHAAEGQGLPNLGPNLTDPNWVHGGAATDIHSTITRGVPTAAMPAWGGPLGPDGVANVTAFVLSMRNTNVEGREPQGEIWLPGAEGGVDD